jgi:hypothetical protein
MARGTQSITRNAPLVKRRMESICTCPLDMEVVYYIAQVLRRTAADARYR